MVHLLFVCEVRPGWILPSLLEVPVTVEVMPPSSS